MSFLENIRPFKVTDLSGFIPVLAFGHEIGLTKPDFARTLSDFSDTWQLTDNGVELSTRFETFDERTKAVDDVFMALSEKGILPTMPDYTAFGGTDWYPVRYRQNAVPLFKVKRFYAFYLGIQNNCVFLNGYHDGEYWLAKRSAFVEEPGFLDVITGGSTRFGESTMETLTHEAHEEAGLEDDDIQRVIPSGSLYIKFIQPDGFLRHEHFHLFDIDLKGKTPKTRLEIEVEGFEKHSYATIMAMIEDGKQIKPHMNLVITDFMIRHGMLTAEHAEFADITHLLYRPTE